jgi:hypothetical protein
MLMFHSRSAVNQAIETDTSFSASYLGVSVSASASHSYNSQYADDRQYAFKSSSVTAYALKSKKSLTL